MNNIAYFCSSNQPKEMNIEVKNARVNNLKNISLNIPHNKFIVVTGVSGSGKSSLAFDTLYAEGQRRYVESLSAYIRQFLGRMHKPECDYIKNLPPAIAIEQKVISRNPRSTVGTTTEIYEYLKLLFARIGRTYSPESGEEVKKHSAEDVLAKAKEFTEGTRLLIASPLKIGEGRTLEKQLDIEILQGYQRIIVNGEIVRIEDYLEDHKDDADLWSKKDDEWDGALLIDRVSLNGPESESRFLSSVETAFYEGQGECLLIVTPSMMTYRFSTRFEADGIKFEEPSENLFSFNSPAGACECCEGFGRIIGIDEKLVIPDTSKSVYEGCVQCWHGDKMGEWLKYFIRQAAHDNFPIFTPYYELSQKHKDWLWHGLPSDPGWEGPDDKVCLDNFFEMIKKNQYKIQYRVMLSRYRGKTVCPKCHGNRLKKEAGYVKVAGRSITDIVEMPVNELLKWFTNIELTEHEKGISNRLLTEITSRLKFLCEVGLGYLTLNRASNTLSGGESQRINLTTQLGSALVGSLYILDEPSIGLHSRDTEQLIGVLKNLRDLGNTVIVVEHDEEIMRAADYIIDIGPDAGNLGGEVVWQGSLNKAATVQSVAPLDDESQLAKQPKNPQSYTLKYISGELSIPLPRSRRAWNQSITLKGARMNNLKGCDAVFPLNAFTAVTGVSGSGKSSLVKGILYPALRRKLGLVSDLPGEFQSIEGDTKSITAVEMVDQNPIGKSARSNAATYIKAYDSIRNLYADQQLSKQMGFTPAYFSFNTDGGRCEECKGAGTTVVEMQFMADLQLTCEACQGKRFKRDILEVQFEGKNINDILDMTISEAISFFANNGQQNIADQLMPLEEVGLGYIKMGQPSSTLSGGENQRVKLASYLGKEKTTPTVFIFDEPTTGLHLHDINKLLDAFNRLIARGHTIIVVEHNLEVIKSADYIIDLGPEGGNKGGNIVFQGKPEDLVKCKESITGRFLKDKL